MTTPQDFLENLWKEQSFWSLTADRLKARVQRVRLLALCLVVAVALASTLTVIVPDQSAWARGLAVGAGLGAAVLAFLRPLWSGTHLKNWVRARSVSEGLKSETYLWLAKAGEYQGDITATRLRERTEQIRLDGADLRHLGHGIQGAVRPLPDVRNGRSYFTVRIHGQGMPSNGKPKGQLPWYTREAEALRTRLNAWAWFERGVVLTGAGVAFVGAWFDTSVALWTTLAMTASAALGVHVAASRYEYQLLEYQRTALALRLLSDRVDAALSESEVLALVVKAEEVVSIENKGWMAKLAEDPPDHQVPSGS
jgi:hypothetical protein